MENSYYEANANLLTPVLIERQCGGFIALTRREIAVRLAAIGATEGEAREGFERVLRGWLRAREAEGEAQRDY